MTGATGAHAGAVTPARATGPHFPCFDGLRALGVMSVIAAHVGFVTGATAQTSWGDYLAHPDLAPALFFFISGFLLYRVYVAGNFAGREPMPVGAFWWRRLLRIFPRTGSRSRCSSSRSGCTSRACTTSSSTTGCCRSTTRTGSSARSRRRGRCAPS